MKSLMKSNRGTAVVEFGLMALPVIVFILGIIQTAWIVWASNLLHVAVDAAARCGAVNSTTRPCFGNSFANMQSTANTVFEPLNTAFVNNTSCSVGSVGISGTYNVTIAFVVNLQLSARSCYPTVTVAS